MTLFMEKIVSVVNLNYYNYLAVLSITHVIIQIVELMNKIVWY